MTDDKRDARGRAPSFQFYPERYLAGTRHLSLEHRGAYMDLLCWMQMHSPDYCSISRDALTDATGLSGKKLAAFMAAIQPDHDGKLLVEEGDRLISNGLRKSRATQVARSLSRQKANKT